MAEVRQAGHARCDCGSGGVVVLKTSHGLVQTLSSFQVKFLHPAKLKEKQLFSALSVFRLSCFITIGN